MRRHRNGRRRLACLLRGHRWVEVPSESMAHPWMDGVTLVSPAHRHCTRCWRREAAPMVIEATA